MSSASQSRVSACSSWAGLRKLTLIRRWCRQPSPPAENTVPTRTCTAYRRRHQSANGAVSNGQPSQRKKPPDGARSRYRSWGSDWLRTDTAPLSFSWGRTGSGLTSENCRPTLQTTNRHDHTGPCLSLGGEKLWAQDSTSLCMGWDLD